MNKTNLARRNPLRAYSLQIGIVGTCVLCLVILWLGLWWQMGAERDLLVRTKMAENRNLVILFEEHVVRTLGTASMTLSQLASDHARLGAGFDVAAFAQSRKSEGHPYEFLSVTDEQGRVVRQSSAAAQPVDLREDEPFQFHRNSQSREIFIGKPRKSADQQRWNFSLSRRIDKPDGSFGGMVTIAIDTKNFAAFYQQLDLGANAVVSLIGRDGIVRARQLGGKFDAGADVGKSALFVEQVPSNKEGTFVGASPSDGIDKIFAYRALSEYPLVVAVGSSRVAVLSAHRQHWTQCFAAAAGITAFSFVLLVFVLHQVAKRRQSTRAFIDSQASLRDSEERFKAFMDRSPVVAFIKDGDGRYVYANKTWENLYALDWRSKTDDELWPGANAEMFSASDRRALDAGQVSESFETVPDKDGRPQDWWVMKFPIVDAAGDRLLAGMAMDITARNRAERERATLQMAIEQQMEGVALLDNGGRYLYMNPAHAAIYGYRMDELIGRSWKVLYDPLQAEKLERDHFPGLMASGHWRGEAIGRKKDGKLFHQELSLARIANPRGAGGAAGFICACRDISAEKQRQRELEEVHVALSNAMPGISRLDTEGCYTSVNDAYAAFLGYAPAELIGEKWTMTVHPEDHAPVVQAFETMLRAGKVEVEVRGVRKDGSILSKQILLVKILDAQGEHVGHHCFMRDVTERKKAEQALRLTRFAMDKVVDEIFMILPSAEIIYANEAACRNLGFSRDELIGKTVHEIDPNFPREAWPAHWQELKQNGAFTFETDHWTKDGRLLKTEVTVNYLEHEGQEYNCAVVRDITARKRAEAALRESEARYLRATAAGRVGVWELNYQTGAYLSDNNLKAMFGYAPAELDTDPFNWLAVVHPADRAAAIAASDAVMFGRSEKYGCELRMICKDGSIKWTDVRGEMTRDEQGKPLRLSGTTVDVSARKEAEEAVRANERSIRRLYEITSDAGQSFDQRMQALLRFGCDRFDLPIGTLTKVVGDALVFTHAFSANGFFDQSATVPVAQSYCGAVLDADNPICIEHIGQSSWCDHPGYALLKLESYMGAPYHAGDLRRGTVCFFGSEPRGKPITEADREFLQLMAAWIGGELARQHAEIALRESERRFHALYDDVPSMYFSVDEAGIVRSVNQFGAAQLGYRPDELTGASVLKVFYADDIDSAREKLAEAFRSEAPVSQWEFRKLRKDGSLLWVREWVRIIEDADGARVALIVCDDITDRKHSEEALRTGERSIRRLYEITNAAELSFDERVRALLALGCSRFALPCGALTQALEDELEIRLLHAPDGSLSEGTRLPLHAAYCNNVMAADEPLCYEHIGASEWRGHPGYPLLGMEAYMGTRILVNGSTFGTLCFLGAQPHDGVFSRADKDFLKLMAVWISGELDRYQTHQQLRNAHDHMRQVIDVDPNFIFAKDRSGRFTLVNKAVADAYGTTVENLVGKTDADFNPNAEQVESFRRKDLEVMDSLMEQFIAEEIITDADGKVRWLQTVKRPILDESGRATQVLGAATDITARKLAEQSLRESERDLRAAQSIAHLGSWSWDIPSGRNSWSDENYRLFGYEPGAVEPNYDTWFNRIHPDDRNAVSAHLDAVLAGTTDYDIDFRVVPCEDEIRHVHALGELVRDDSGAPLRMAGTVLDITGRKRAEAALRWAYDGLERRVEERTAELQRAVEALSKTEALLQQAVDVANLGVFERDHLSGEVYYSPTLKQILKFPDDRRDKLDDYFSRVHVDDRDAVTAARQRAHEPNGHGHFSMEHRIMRADGSIGWVLNRAQTVFEGTGDARRPVRTVGAVLDITERKRSEELLRKNQEWLNQAVNVGDLGIFEHDFVTDELSFSEVFRRMLDWPDDLTPSSSEFRRRLHPDDRERVVLAIRAAHESVGGALDLEYRVVRRDGSIGWLLVRARLFFEGIGATRRLLRSVGAALDITERKHAEEALRASEERLQHALAVGQMGTWERDLRTGEIFWDERAYAMFGIAQGTTINADWFFGQVHPDDRSAMLDAIRRSEEDGVGYQSEFRFLRPDGITVWVLAHGGLRRDGVGVVTHMAGINFDITERKRAEEALRESEARLRAILDHNPGPVFIKDLAGRYMHVNRQFEELFGLNGDSSTGKTDADLFTSAQAEMFSRNDRQVIAAGAPMQFEELAQYRDGMHTSLVNKFPLCDRAGAIYGLCGIATDITERKAMENALRQMNQELDLRVAQRTQQLAESQAGLRALVGQLTQVEERERRRLAVELHDTLAQSLAVSNMYLWRIRELLGGEAEAAPINEVLKSLDRTIEDSIKYTRSLIAELSPPVLYDLGLPAAFRWLGDQMARHGLRVEVDGPEADFSIAQEDAVFLFQCVRELLWNVVKHGATDCAKIAYGRDANGLSLAVVDHGKGFDLQTVRANGDGGNHFGLFSIRERVELRGGRVEIDSAPGIGTWVAITIPTGRSAGTVAKSAAPAAPAQFIPADVGDSIRIVIADDHKMLRQGLRRALEEQGHFVIVGEASDGQEAVLLARQLEPAVVIMDINMPTMNGIEATQEIIRAQPATIVIGVSFGTEDYIVQAMQAAGAVTCLPKERAVEDVSQAILDAMAARQAVRIEN